MDASAFSFEQGAYLDVWLVRWQGRPIGAVANLVRHGFSACMPAWRGRLAGADALDQRSTLLQ